jgi:hypothetical protein
MVLEGRENAKGHLSLRGLDGSVTEREVSADNCAEVASALALIAALALDPTATTATVGRPSPNQRKAPSGGALLADLLAPPLPATLAPTVDRAAARLRFALGVSGTAAVGVSPNVLLGGFVFAELAREARPFSFAIRVGIDRSLSGRIDLARGAADVARTIGEIELRPWSLAVEQLTFAPTVAVELGVLHADGSNIPAPAHPTRAWTAIDAGAGASFGFYGPLFLDLAAAASIPFTRDSFYVAPNPALTVFRASAVAFRGALGLGARFP